MGHGRRLAEFVGRRHGAVAEWPERTYAEGIGLDAIGSYSVVRRLDPGGALGAEAYLAVRSAPAGPEGLNVLVVVAVDGATRAQAAHSLAAVSTLKHPASAPVLDHFDHDGKLVLALEHHDGLRIEQIQERLRLDEERLTDLAVWQMAHQLFGALAEAHEASDPTGTPLGLAHGHLGPDVVHIGWDGQLRLLGMGLDRLFLDDERSEAALAYRPPEHGSLPAAGPPGDLYAAGAIIWSLLTGRRPPVKGDRFQSLAEARDDLPPALTEAIDLTLAAQPHERRITARAIVERLERELPTVTTAADLRWSIEVFRALSLFSPSTSPPPSTRPIDFRPEERPQLAGPAGEPEIAEPPMTVEVPTLRHPSASEADDAPATREDWPRPLDELDMPTIEPATRRRPGLVAEDEDAGEPRTHVMERPDFDALKPPGSTLVSPSSDEPEEETTSDPAAALDAVMPLPERPRPEKIHTLVSESSSLDGQDVVALAMAAASQPAPTPPPETPSAQAPAVQVPQFAPGGTDTVSPGVEPAAPASLPISLPAGVPRGSLLPRLALGALAVIGGATIGWLVLADRIGSSESSPGTAQDETAEVSKKTSTKPTSSGAPSAGGLSTRPAGDTAAAASPGTTTTPAPTTAPTTEPAADLSGLLSYEGYLVVQSRAKADVYVQGLRLGETNQQIKSRCYRRFVRLKDSSTGTWLGPGQAVQIECGAVTTVRIEP